MVSLKNQNIYVKTNYFLLLHAFKSSEDVGSVDKSDDLSASGNDWQSVDLVLEHDGSSLSHGVCLLNGSGRSRHDISDGVSLLGEISLGDETDTDILAIDDRNSSDVVQDGLDGLLRRRRKGKSVCE